MINKKKIVHIYYNTSGNSGLYLNPIDNALKNEFEQVFLVNYYYPIECDRFKRIFFKFTEKNENNSYHIFLENRKFRKIIRFLELESANRKILQYVKRNRPDAINYSLTNMPFALELLKKIKKILPQCKIIVTCHDVVPFQATKRIDYQGIYNFADFLLVHSNNAIHILENEYRIHKEKIVYHPFPLIDLSLLKAKNEKEEDRVDKDVPHFLFIGVMRAEKGVQTLIDAWKILGPKFKGTLRIAGFKPDDVNLDISGLENFHNFKICMKSLSDDEYYHEVDKADYVVFPYFQVGNSGVLSTIVSLGKVPVTTKLPTFQELDYCMDKLSCKPGDPEALAQLLKKISLAYTSEYNKEVAFVTSMLLQEKKKFADSTLQAYQRMLG